MKKIFLSFLYFVVASLAFVPVSRAETTATFNVFTPYYYAGSISRAESSAFPSVVTGNRGPILSGESMSATVTYVLNGNVPAGYGISEWQLRPSMNSSTVIKSQPGGTSFQVTFDVAWAKKYGTALNLIVYLKPITYTLSYNANGGDWTAGEPEGGEYEYNATVEAPGAECVEREDYTFTGWKANGGSLIEPGATFSGSNLGVTKSGTVVLYAQWGAATYSVTLNKDGGTIAKGRDVTSYTYGVGATLPTLEKKNCTFAGWYDNPLLTSNVVTQISKTDSGDKEFWAKFTRQDTVVHYNGNGATDGTMTDSAFAEGKPMALAANAFKRAYAVTYDANGGSTEKKTDTATYTFKNWNDKADGSGAYTYNDMQDVTNPCGSTGDPVTLYAQWNDEPVTVTLPTIKEPEGKVFDGWYTAQSGGIRVGGADDKYEPPRNITLYAHWKGEKTYTIHFSPNATVTNPDAMKDVACKSGVAVTLDECKFTNLAATDFVGWEYGGKTYKAGDSFNYDIVNVGETVVLKAVWKNTDPDGLGAAVGLDNAVLTNVARKAELAWTPNLSEGGIECRQNMGSEMAMTVWGEGKICFECNVARDAVENLKCIFSIDGTERKGIDAIGWAQHSESISGKSGPHVLSWRVEGRDILGNCVQIKNMTWSPSDTARTITASANPSASAGTVTGGGRCDIGETVRLTATENPGYTFKHWSDGSTDASHTVDVTCDETYQAIFSGGESEVPCYYILFNGNGADNLAAMDGQTMPCGTATALTANKFSRSGFKFSGWATKRTGSVAYADKATVKDLAAQDKTVTLYAVWEESSKPEPGKTAVTVTITGTTKTVKYTGKKQTISGYTFKSDVAAYKESYCKFTGVAKVSGIDVGEYPMGLEESDFTNKDDDYSVTFVVNDGKLVITGDDPGPEPGGNEGVEIDFGGAETGASSATVGVGTAVEWTVTPLEDNATVTISKLPTGLKYNKKTGLITGMPTKAKDYAMTVKTKANGSTVTQTFAITVEALPAMMVGTYYGAAEVDGIAGQFQLKLTAAGKATGYFYAAGKKVSLKSTALGEAGGCYVATVSYTHNKTKCTDEIVLAKAATVEGAKGDDVDIWAASVSGSAALEKIDARRDVIKEVFGKVVPKTATYDVEDESFEEGEYLKAKVTTSGKVTVSGKLLSEAGKLTSVSCSTNLIVDDEGNPYCWITIYKTVSKSEPIVHDEIWYLPDED